MKNLPEARTQELVIQNNEEETLVYDLTINKAHNLNKLMSFIWDNCNGKNDWKNLSRLLEENLKIKTDEDFINLALNELNRVNLLKKPFPEKEFLKISRRKVLLKYALPVSILPVILSLPAPTAAQAASCPTTTCTTDPDCTSPTFPFCTMGCCSGPMGGCTSDTDCLDPMFPVCDTMTGTCVGVT